MKKLIWVLLVLYGCGGGAPTTEEPVPEYCGASLIWEAPVMRWNGLPLSTNDFDRFTIYVAELPGKRERDLIRVIDVLDNEAVTYYIDNLPYRELYIYMTVTDTDSRVSPISQEWSWNCVVGKPYE